jgi:hypothetical protein
MAIILDADVIIKGEKGNFDLIAWLDTQSGQDLEIAAITVAERGMELNVHQPHIAQNANVISTQSSRGSNPYPTLKSQL